MLKVRESLGKDVGRCLARMDPQDMIKYGVSEGQIVEIEGISQSENRRRTPVRVLSCDSEERGKQIIQIDGVTRDNAGVAIDDKVSVRKIDHHFAGSITLRPLTTMALLEKERDAR